MNFDAIAHDLKTPLATVLGTARLIGAENLSAEARRRLTVIEVQVHRMSVLIDYLLAGTTGEIITEDHAGDILREATRDLEPLLQRAGLTLTLREDEDVPSCRCARTALHRVIVNLLKNAIDATPSGGTISCHVGPADTHQVAIEISDTGTGMPASVLDRAFDRGFTTKARQDGHGLGLAIARELLSEQGGAIAISSQPGCGTCVTLTLPRASTAVPHRAADAAGRG